MEQRNRSRGHSPGRYSFLHYGDAHHAHTDIISTCSTCSACSQHVPSRIYVEQVAPNGLFRLFQSNFSFRFIQRRRCFMTTRFDHLIFIYWCDRCRHHYCRELEEPQTCGCGCLEAEHLATIDPRLVLPELLNRKKSLAEIRHGTAPHARKEIFSHDLG